MNLTNFSSLIIKEGEVMKKKTITLIVALPIVISILGLYPVLNKKSATSKDSDTLKIYLSGQNGNYSKRTEAVINEFEKKYPETKIDKVIFDSSYGPELCAKKILIDTLSGDGPDILDLSEINTRKMERSGMLLDLNPLIEKDKDFKKDDYNSKIIQAGMFGAEQLIMPLDYYVNQYITTEELLKKNNIKLENKYSQEDFMNALDGYITSIKGDKNKFLFATPMGLEKFLAGSGEEFIDYNSKKIYFDKPQFKELIQNYKKIYQASRKKADIMGISGIDGYEALKNGNALFSNDDFDLRGTFFIYESLIKQTLGETQVINTLPTYNGGDNVSAIIGEALAINKNTKNKTAAYNFIKIAISEDIQSDSKLPSCIPVNKKAAMDLESQYMKKEVNTIDNFSSNVKIQNQPLSEDFQKYYSKVVNNVENAEIINSEIDDIMMESLTPYFEDKASYESCVKVLENKVNLYINE